jgi:hypothetical protein
MDSLPICYDPESMDFQSKSKILNMIYLECYPWHGTDQAKFYDYPSFVEAVEMWAKDEFYKQHLLSKLYLKDRGIE